MPAMRFRHRPSPCYERLGSPDYPTILQSASRRADFSGLPGSLLLRPVKLLAPCADLTRTVPATGTVEETGEYDERKLNHSDGEAERFYRTCSREESACV